MIDSISVNIGIKDGNVTVYPFEISMDRYRAAVGGTYKLMVVDAWMLKNGKLERAWR